MQESILRYVTQVPATHFSKLFLQKDPFRRRREHISFVT